MKWLTPPMLARVLVGLVVLYEVSVLLYGIFAEAAQGRPFESFLWVVRSSDPIITVQLLLLILGYATIAVALLLCIVFVIDLVRKRMK